MSLICRSLDCLAVKTPGHGELTYMTGSQFGRLLPIRWTGIRTPIQTHKNGKYHGHFSCFHGKKEICRGSCPAYSSAKARESYTFSSVTTSASFFSSYCMVSPLIYSAMAAECPIEPVSQWGAEALLFPTASLPRLNDARLHDHARDRP